MPRRKIPTKAELIRLQKLYKTDEKIAERLGNVTAQLVAYWRRKKNIPRHSFPKFSYDEIKDLWERYGDDYRCGLDLGLSKAAFYNWRRKYKIRQKPAFLKLEQLELNLGESGRSTGHRTTYDRRTITRKILAGAAKAEKVEVGETVTVEPDVAMMSNDIVEVIKRFQATGLNYIWNPNRLVVTLDVWNDSSPGEAAETLKQIRDFVKRQNIKYYYDIDDSGCHQLVVERARILPGQLAVSTSAKCPAYGCLGALAMAVDNKTMAELWSSGGIEVKVPETIKIQINGKTPPGVYTKDVSLFIAKKLANAARSDKIIEYYGPTVSSMSISERFTLASMAGDLGALSAVCPFDSMTRRYLLRRSKMPYRPALADKNADYSDQYEFNVDRLRPMVARPGGFDDVEEVANVTGLTVDQIVIGSCTNGRFDDLRIAADILKGKKVSRNVRLIIIPSSKEVYLEALKKGLIRAFLEVGATVLNPGCGFCDGGHFKLATSGERCLVTSGRLLPASDDNPELYLVSPATAAASALKGVLTDPTPYMRK